MDVAAEELDGRREGPPGKRDWDLDGSPPPPPPRRKDRDADRPPNRRDGYHESTSKSPPPPPPPPPLGTSRGDKDKEYSRRSSRSPPYRDMRRSPPRRSPPPAKRSRRDDGGYARRRGSPRYGYDYGGQGGRTGSTDERNSVRHMNRSDWQDSGRGDFADGSNRREGLMSYKQFIQELEDDILPAEAERRYEEYRSEYISTQKRTYFEVHKEEDWLKDKYHPTNLVAVIERRNLKAKEMMKEFVQDLQNGTLDLGPALTASSNKYIHGSAPSSEDEAENNDKRRRKGRGSIKESDLASAPKAPSLFAEPRRIQFDIDLAQALVRKLDSEKGIEGNILASSDRKKVEGDKSHDGSMGPIIIVRGLTTVRGLEGVELLDTLITYLWRIHGLDYYGVSEKPEPKGLRHVRAEDQSHDGPSRTASDWEKKLETVWQARLHGQDLLEAMTAKEKIDAAAVEVLEPYVRKIRDEKYGWKYGCGAKGCTKLFHAAEFVHKHLKLKHPDLVIELTSKVREDLYFQNYMNDSDAPGGTPVMQQPASKDRAPRRRPISERLRDERGNRRGREDTDKSPSHDNGPGDTDDHMFDAYDRQGLRGGPFPSDISPPPVLMPVPGAGPLGPFVPAPPEVAMRMMREQGGPSPYEGNGGRGRRGRPGPPMGGPPIITMPSAFSRDPRGLRSYQDLDAPENEVTVIDYRSL